MDCQCHAEQDQELLAYRAQLEARAAEYQRALDQIQEELDRVDMVSAA